MKKIEFAAKVAHEVNKAFCTSLGDMSQPSWNDAPKWQKDSAIAGALQILNNPSTTPQENHESWIKMKRDDGWVRGPNKDPVKKEHPCLVEYHELPQQQQTKNLLFCASVLAVLGSEVEQ